MSNIEVYFASPLWLLLMIPACAAVLAAWRMMRRGEGERRAERLAMLLRMAEMVLLALIISGLNVVTYSPKRETKVLVDKSGSMEAAQEAVDDAISRILQDAGEEDAIEIIPFAGENAEATDIAGAMDAAAVFHGQGGRRMLLVTDGAATDGDLAAAAARMAQQGVRVDVLHVDTTIASPEAEMTAFTLPADASQGQRFSASVTAMANQQMTRTLRILDGDMPVHEQEVALLPGENTFAVSLTASGLGMHTYSAELAGEGDAVAQNNRRFAAMRVSSSARILLVDGDGAQTQKLGELLMENGSSVDVVTSENLPDTVAALCEYGLIVLMNVDANDLPEGSAQRLGEYVASYGRSVLTTGGGNTYIYGGMKGTPFEEFLPVRMSVEEKESVDPVALMLVIDVTDSMTRQSMGVPIEMAKRGAIKCVDALNSNDYAGVITFADEAQVLVEMTPMESKEGVLSAIHGIETASPDKLTKFSDALKTACDTLKAFDKLERKHIIFITDGSPADGKDGFDGIVKQMRQNGITLSTIAVGRIMNVVKLLEGLSAIGGGRCYFVEGASDLPDIMSTDTVLSQVEYTIDAPVIPQAGTRVFAIDDPGALTQLYGYIRTAAKGSASVALATPEGRPVYAQWDYGAGKAASFMSDLSGNWSRNWFLGEPSRRLIADMIRGLIPDTFSQAGVDITLVSGGARGVLSLRSDAAADQHISARILPPQGDAFDAAFEQKAEGLYQAEIPLQSAGRYDLTITWRDAQGNETGVREASVTHSFSREYETVSRSDGMVAMLELADAAGGAVVSDVKEWLAIDPGTTQTAHDAALPLSIAVMLCLLADILIRRTKLRRLRSLFSGRGAR